LIDQSSHHFAVTWGILNIFVNAGRRRGRGILVGGASARNQSLEDVTFKAGRGLLGFLFVGFKGLEQTVDAVEQAKVDDFLVLESLNLVFAVDTLLVNLVLLCTDKGTLVDIGMDLDIRVVG
jgi:hypothetical protein